MKCSIKQVQKIIEYTISLELNIYNDLLGIPDDQTLLDIITKTNVVNKIRDLVSVTEAELSVLFTPSKI